MADIQIKKFTDQQFNVERYRVIVGGRVTLVTAGATAADEEKVAEHIRATLLAGGR